MEKIRKNMKRKYEVRHSPKTSKRDKICRNIIEYGLMGLIIFSPLPAASVDEWCILLIQLTVIVMVAAYLMIKEKPTINPHLSQSLRWPKYLFIGFFVFLFFQILPFPLFLVKILTPHTYAFQQQFSFEISKMKFLSLSLAPSYTFREGLELLSYILIGFLIIHTVTTRRQIRRIFILLVSMGFFEAFYGLFELHRKNPRILFYKKDINLGAVTGTFVNQNHLAGYLEMIIPLAIGLVIARIDLFTFAEKRLREKIIHFAQKGFIRNLILTTFVVVMSLAIFLSRSRSGAFLLVLTFIVFFGLTLVYFGRISYHRVGIRRFLQATFLLITVISLYIGIGATIERFATDTSHLGGRPSYWGSLATIIGDFPLVGTGLGTFVYVYPAYSTARTYGWLVHAHNDYFEYISELGLVGILFLLGGILFIAIKSFMTWYERRNAEVKGMALGGIISIFIIAVHSFTDFNMHIPANMLLFSVILSLTLVTATYKQQKKKWKKRRRLKRI